MGPKPDESEDEEVRDSAERAWTYMGLGPGTPMEAISVDRVVVGSCTNGRRGELREVARILDGKRVHSSVHAMVVPGSTAVRRQAESEGLDRVFKDAGFEWREAGCSMCIGMNPDTLSAGERCASTTNRNFEGRIHAQIKTNYLDHSIRNSSSHSEHVHMVLFLIIFLCSHIFHPLADDEDFLRDLINQPHVL